MVHSIRQMTDFITSRYTNVDMKISLFVPIHIKIIQ